MNDRWEYTILADQSEENARRVKCKISPGTLKTLIIYFPPGCHNLARCRIFLGEKPIAPRSAKSYIAADDMAFTLHHVNEPITEDLPVLNWDVWNVDETHPHTIWMAAEWISAREPYEKTMVDALLSFVSTMKRFIGVR